ncbi:hypothetical protein F5Y04DRAFT_75482 [Hypomontagnella monticulosa]|nr:hypothetical protein F5Y04DRAFT_75482 [Hypomontagnella monticulosa]
MDSSPPSCSLEDFRQPRLRRCAFPLDTLRFTSSINPNPTLRYGATDTLDGGMDGYNWKVHFGDAGPFVLKLFWDTEPPPPPYYFAAQRECQNAALLQMMQAAFLPDHAETSPVLIQPPPTTMKEARRNLLAFSDERRRAQSRADSTLSPVTSIPRMRQCYGWLKLTSDDVFRLLPDRLYPFEITLQGLPRRLEKGLRYTAIIYEYIEDTGNSPEAIQQVLDFLRSTGFAHNGSWRACNWKGGVLVDHSDFVHPGGCGWHPKRLECTAAQILRS